MKESRYLISNYCQVISSETNYLSGIVLGTEDIAVSRKANISAFYEMPVSEKWMIPETSLNFLHQIPICVYGDGSVGVWGFATPLSISLTTAGCPTIQLSKEILPDSTD